MLLLVKTQRTLEERRSSTIKSGGRQQEEESRAEKRESVLYEILHTLEALKEFLFRDKQQGYS